VLIDVFQPVIQSFDGQTLAGKKRIVKKILTPPAPCAIARAAVMKNSDLRGDLY
jgi:hypothetical protein